MIALTLSLLFGLGWGVGLLATQSLYTVTAIRDLFAALFILLTSFQGLFIFLMHCARSREVRLQWTKWIYKAAGRDLTWLSSNSTSLSKRSTLNKSNNTKTNLSRSATLKEYVSKSYDEDNIITGHELDKIGKLEEGRKVGNNKLARSDAVSSPADSDHLSTYPLPSDFRFSKEFASDFRSSSTSISSGLCRNYENPFEGLEDQLSLSSECKRSHDDPDYCLSNLPNPMLDTNRLSGVCHDEK